MDKKPWYQSKTIWFNVVAAALAAAGAATDVLQPVLGENGIYVMIAGVLPVANMILRAATSQPLGKPPESTADK